MKGYLYILINFIGVLFLIDALLIIAYWLFGFELNLPHNVQSLMAIAGMFLIVLAPIISLVNIYYVRNRKTSKILGFTYLSLWVCILIRMLVVIC
jgi:hypothetical protein